MKIIVLWFILHYSGKKENFPTYQVGHWPTKYSLYKEQKLIKEKALVTRNLKYINTFH